MKVSNFLIALACAVAAVSMTGSMLPAGGGTAPELYAQVGMPNPWTDQDSMEDAQLATDFSFTVPETIGTMQPVLIQTLGSEVIQVFYRETADSEEHVLLRKGFSNQDVSGDYNVYSESAVKTVGNYQVTFQGDDGRVMLATWVSGRFSYCVSAPAMTAEEVEAIVAAMK